jgi:tRNA(fMet)-specific endonuclease VapC
MTHLLDTDTVSYALRGHGRVAESILAHQPSELCLSVVTLAELRYGADLRHSQRLHQLIDAFIAGVRPVPFDAAAAERYGKVAAALARAGVPIGQNDAMIAAHALHLGCTVVTNNVAHFRRVRGLAVENWV